MLGAGQERRLGGLQSGIFITSKHKTMINTADTITLEDSANFATGQGRQFRAPDVYCILRTLDMRGDGVHQVEVQALDADGVYMGGTYYTYTTSQVNGKTGTGADDAAKYFNCIEQLVLDDLADHNPAATLEIV